MRNLTLLMAAPLAACTSIQPALPAAAPADSCEDPTLGQYAGQPATSDLGAAMLRATGKTVLRWVQPGMAVTMDYREDRLTVSLDSANKVERVSCG